MKIAQLLQLLLLASLWGASFLFIKLAVPHFGVVLAIRDTDYKIVSHKPDGTGLSRLILSAKA